MTDLRRDRRYLQVQNNGNSGNNRNNEECSGRGKYILYERFGSDKVEHEDRLIVIQTLVMSLLFCALTMGKANLLVKTVLFTLLFWCISKYFLIG